MSETSWQFSVCWPEEKPIRPKFSEAFFISTVTRYTTDQGSIRYQRFQFTKEDAKQALSEIYPNHEVNVYDSTVSHYCKELDETSEYKAMRWCFGVSYERRCCMDLIRDHPKYDLIYTVRRIKNHKSEQLGFISLKWLTLTKDEAYRQLIKLYPPNSIIKLYNSDEVVSCPFPPPLQKQQPSSAPDLSVI